METPIELRGHHLEAIASILRGTFAEHAEELLHYNYAVSKDDPFVRFSYEYPQQLFANPEQQFLVVSGTPDFICHKCNLKRKCFDEDNKPLPIKRFLGDAFKLEEIKALEERNDTGIARKYGFEPGKIYSSKEIREKMKF